MHPQLIYNIIFEGKCSEHFFFNNINEVFEKALVDWSNIGSCIKNKNNNFTKEQNHVISLLNEERTSLICKMEKYKSFVQHNNLVFEFNLNDLMDNPSFVSAESLISKKNVELTLIEKDFFDFIDGFIEEIEYKIIKQYSLLCIRNKRFDNIPKMKHILFNR